MLPVASEVRLPKYLGEYAVLRPLFRGRERLRYAVRREPQEHPRLYVVKLFPPVPEGTPETERERYVPRLTRGLSHRNLVESYQVGEREGLHYLVMEYVLSVDLGFVLQRCREKGERLPLGVVLYLGREICRGLAFLHGFGADKLLHGRLAPSHVLLAYSGQVKLAHVHRLLRVGSTTYVEQEGGAPVADYQAPELLEGRPVDQRADVFAVGAMLWEALAGQRFVSGDPSAGVQGSRDEILAAGAAGLPLANPDVPGDVVDLLTRALRPQPEDRFRNAVDLGRRLDGLMEAHCPEAGGRATSDWLVVRFRDEFRERRRLQQQILADKRAETSSHRVQETGEQVSSFSRDLIGQVFDQRYRVLHLIGEGGMGQVYEAEHTQLGKRLAVKVLHPLYSTEEEVVERFRREARAASSIGHPNIVNVTDSGTTPDGRAYFVMELLDGMELADVITQEGPLDYERAVDIAIQVCQALGAAHRVGIIHRDMKPENVFLTTVGARTDVVKILDFGIAKSARLERVRGGQLTEPGLAVGTPEYMAPEQAAGKPPDPRFDIYAVGGILYAVLTGRPPHRGSNVMEILTRKATRNSTPPRSYRPDIPVELERVIMMALSRNPERRPQTMEEFEYELRKSLQGRPDAVAHMLGISDALSLVQHERPRAAASQPWSEVEETEAAGFGVAAGEPAEAAFRSRPTVPESGMAPAIELAEAPGAWPEMLPEDSLPEPALPEIQSGRWDAAGAEAAGPGSPPTGGGAVGVAEDALLISDEASRRGAGADGTAGPPQVNLDGLGEADSGPAEAAVDDELATTSVYVPTGEILLAEQEEAERALRRRARQTLVGLALGCVALAIGVWRLWPGPPVLAPGERGVRTRGGRGSVSRAPEGPGRRAASFDVTAFVGKPVDLPRWRPTPQAEARWRRPQIERWVAFAYRAARDRRFLTPPLDCVAHGLKQIRALDPEHPALGKLIKLAERYLVAQARRARRRGRFEEADRLVRGLLALAPESRRGKRSLLLLLVARAHQALARKQVAAAEAFIKEAVEIDPKSVEVQLAGAQILLAQDKLPEALAVVRRVRKAHRRNPEARRLERTLVRTLRRRRRRGR